MKLTSLLKNLALTTRGMDGKEPLPRTLKYPCEGKLESDDHQKKEKKERIKIGPI